MKTEVIGSRAETQRGPRYLLFFDVDSPYGKEDHYFLRRFAERQGVPLYVIKSSDRGFHIISFSLMGPDSVSKLQNQLAGRYDDHYLNIMETFEFNHPNGNRLRIGYKNGDRPREVLDEFPVTTQLPASNSHVRLYELLTLHSFTIKQPREETILHIGESELKEG